MAFNLDFSGWADARKAMANSIINQSNIAAESARQIREGRERLISGLLSTGVDVANKYVKDKKNKETEALIAQTLLGAGDAVDPMQAASAMNALTPSISDPNYQEYIAWKNSKGL